MVGAEVLWQPALTSNGAVKHATECDPIDRASMDAETNDPSRVLIHNHQDPVDPVWRSVRLAGAELTARCWSNQNRAESLAREDRNGEVEKGQSSLRNFSATRGASAPIPSHLAIEPARFALRHGQRNAVGRGSRSEAETLSPAREARDRALRVPCFSQRERDRDGRRGCSDGDSTESPRSLRRAHDDEIYTRDLRGRPQDRGSIRRTAYMLAHRGDHSGGKRIILVSNGAKFEWRRRASD